jgi:hypothetical protein
VYEIQDAEIRDLGLCISSQGEVEGVYKYAEMGITRAHRSASQERMMVKKE